MALKKIIKIIKVIKMGEIDKVINIPWNVECDMPKSKLADNKVKID